MKKLRSQEWFGRQDRDGFIYRSWMKNQGWPHDMFNGRPVIGICNTWSEFTPCNAHFREIAEWVKRGVWEAGGFPLEFPVMSLGEVLLKEKKYPQAAAELDKAAILAPADPWTRIQLGKSYLLAGQNHDALAAFEKAVEVSPTPDVQSHIAGIMADANQDLDPALRYAESAVATTEAAMRGAKIDHIGRKDFSAMAVLDYCWQTLGWVHFQRGELDAAEKYLHAAWQLDPNSEVTERLGQLYEKRGNGDLAVQIYGTADPVTPEIHARLVTLTGSPEYADRHIRDSAAWLKAMLTFPLGKFSAPGTQAEFMILVARSGSGNGTTVGSSAFIDGEQKLRPLSERLRSIPFKGSFPDAHLEKLLRRGTVTCSAASECAFVLQPIPGANQ